MLPPGVNAPNTAAPAESLPAKKQAVVDRLRRRIDTYRRRQTDFMPRFGQSFNGFCEQNIQETMVLKQKFLENKNKRAVKKQDKKQPDPVSNLIAQQKFLKRPADDEGDFGGDSTSAKLPCVVGNNQGGNTGGAGNNAGAGLTKFSVEIVQQLEFTTSAANSQPQQISTNVTVKAMTNASVKSDVESPKPTAPSPATPIVECKQEPDTEFVDLEQCAAALEKDAQNNSGFPGLSELIGQEGSDEIFNSDAFKDLISEISGFHPELMKDFDFDHFNTCKVEVDSKEGIVPQQQQFTQFEGNAVKQNIRMPSNAYSGLEFGKGEMSPAAQTLKQMAEQHQHKAQMGIGFPPARRSPYSEYPFQMSQNQSASAEVKQEVLFSVNQSQNLQAGVRSPSGAKTPTLGGYKQQYSPYSSPGASSSPGYMPRGQGPGQMPPRPTSVPSGGVGGTPGGASVQMNQAQQMHINQRSPGPQIQVSSGMQLNSDLKTVSIAAQQQQGMFFTPSSAENSYTVSQSQTINFTQQSLRQRPVLRPPPPDYKTMQQQPHSMPQQRFQQQAPVRRPGPGQQPMPPSGMVASQSCTPPYAAPLLPAMSQFPSAAQGQPPIFPVYQQQAPMRIPGPGQQPMPPSGMVACRSCSPPYATTLLPARPQLPYAAIEQQPPILPMHHQGFQEQPMPWPGPPGNPMPQPIFRPPPDYETALRQRAMSPALRPRSKASTSRKRRASSVCVEADDSGAKASTTSSRRKRHASSAHVEAEDSGAKATATDLATTSAIAMPSYLQQAPMPGPGHQAMPTTSTAVRPSITQQQHDDISTELPTSTQLMFEEVLQNQRFRDIFEELTGPMMRPQMSAGGAVYMSGGGMPRTMPPAPPPGATGYHPRPRPPNVSVGPDGLPLGSGPRRGDQTEWRNVMMNQQQNAVFSPTMRTFTNHPGTYQVQNNVGSLAQLHQQPMRTPMHMLPQMMQSPVSAAHQVRPAARHMSMNLQMSQSQSMSVGGPISSNHNNQNAHALQFHHLHHGASTNTLATGPSDGGGGGTHHQSNGSLGATDLTLELLENMNSEGDFFGNFDFHDM